MIKIKEETQLISATIPDWVNELDNSIHMPRIQRGFVWKPEQIALLWDSLFRGMPFGTLLVAKINKTTLAKSGDELKEVSDGWQLLDGQQRSRTIQGGFNYKQSGFRIWLGLVPQANQKDLVFDIRVCTQEHPFSFDKNFKKLNLSTRRIAYERFTNKQDSDNTHKKQIEPTIKTLDLENSEPYVKHENVYIALDDLLANNANIPELFEKKANELGIDITKFYVQVSRIKKAVSAIHDINIYALRVNEKLFEFKGEINPQDDDAEPGLDVLFKRVALGGKPLSNNDYAYSLIKQKKPALYNLVESISHKAHSINVFSALDIVAIALRASCALAAEGRVTTDKDSYNKNTIYRILHNQLNSFYIEKRLLEQKVLEKSIEMVLSKITYCAKSNVNGLPTQLLTKIPKSIIQVIVIHHLNESFCFGKNELISFCLFYLLIKPNAKDNSKISHTLLSLEEPSIESYIIELKQHYQKEKDLDISLIDAKTVSEQIKKAYEISSNDSSTLDFPIVITLANRLKGYSCKTIAQSFWRNESLLIWLQRDYLNMLMNSNTKKIAPEITPYDFDHIIPQDYWARGNSGKGKQFHKFVCQDEPWSKNSIGNSIGNYQLLSFSDNRSKSNLDYHQSSKDIESEKLQADYKISIEAHAYFLKTPNQKEEWEASRVKDFQSGVVLRTCELYQQLISQFEGLKYYF
jgi:hypothetical protein